MTTIPVHQDAPYGYVDHKGASRCTLRLVGAALTGLLVEKALQNHLGGDGIEAAFSFLTRQFCRGEQFLGRYG